MIEQKVILFPFLIQFLEDILHVIPNVKVSVKPLLSKAFSLHFLHQLTLIVVKKQISPKQCMVCYTGYACDLLAHFCTKFKKAVD